MPPQLVQREKERDLDEVAGPATQSAAGGGGIDTAGVSLRVLG